MKISIIIPVYNVADYVYSCLQSVANQTICDNLECLVIDDCGQDNSIEIVQKFIDDYTGRICFRIVHRANNGGLSEARNSGIKEASGDYLFFLDADDELTPTAMESLTAPIQEYPFDIVVGEYIISPKGSLDIHQNIGDKKSLFGNEILDYYSRSCLYITACNKLYSSTFLSSNKLSFLPGVIHEDELWSFQSFSLAHSVALSKSESYIYKIRQGSISTASKLHRRVSSLVTITEQMREFVLNNGLTDNLYIHDKLQRWFFELMNSIQSFSKEERLHYYVELRSIILYSRKSVFTFDYSSIRRIVRDFHLFLPNRMGFLLQNMLSKHFLHV